MGMGEIEKMNRGESRVSGSYIRHLVKHLSNSSREPTNSKVSNGDGTYRNLEGFDKNQPPQSQRRTREATPQKKRVRRRLNTTKPYQERLLNMAEARREIVAALKYHRETMKKEQEQKQIQEQQIKSLESIDVVKSERNSKNQNTNRDLPFSRFSSHVAPHPFVFSYPWNSPQILPAPSSIEDLNLILPPKTLGLNLNLDSFENLERIPYSNKTSSGSSIYTSFSLSPLSSSSPSSPIIVELPCITSSAISTPSKSNSTEPSSSTGMIHTEMGSQDVGEIRSIEEQDGVEWNDTLNLESSDWWINVLNPTELDTDNNHNGNDKDVLHLFDDSLEICGENCFSLSHVHHCCHPDQLLEEASLPCLNIWDIEEMGDIWLS